MRVALFNDMSEVGGAEVNLLQTASILRQRGVDVVLVVPESGELVARTRDLGLVVRMGRFVSPRLPRNVGSVFRAVGSLVRAAAQVADIVREERIDVVHANSVRAGIMASMGRLRHRRPVVWSVHEYNSPNVFGAAARFYALVSAARVVANSEAVRSDFAWWPRLRRKTVVVHPGIPAAALESGRGPSSRAAWGIDGDEFVVGSVGQITPIKRFDDAIRVCEEVSRSHPRVRLVIVGAAKFRPENRDYLGRLEQMVRERGLRARVLFTGFQEPMEPLYRAFDVLLHPAEREGFGRVIVEAMAQRVPVIATREGGIPEILRDGEGGYLVRVGDVSAMADRVRRLADDPELRLTLGERGRARAREFEWERVVTRLLSVYAEVSSRAAPLPVTR